MRVEQFAPAAKQKLSMDLNFANQQLMTDPNMVDMVYRKYAEYTPMGFLGIGIGDNQGIDEVSIGRRDVASTMIRWRALDDTPQVAMIVDSLSVPTVIKPGVNFQMSIDEGFYEPDAIFTLIDKRYNIMITGKTPSSGSGTSYLWQLVGMDPDDTSFPVRLLQTGKPLQYAGNSKGEKSSTSQPVGFRHNKAEDFYNVTQFMRHEVDASGHFLTNKMWTGFMEQFYEGNELKERVKGVLPFSRYAMDEHFKRVAHTMYWGTGNFNPLTRQIINKSTSGSAAYNERPTMSGMREQFDSTRHVFHYDPFASKAKNAEMLERIVQMQRSWLKIPPEDMLEVMILTRDGGEQVLFDIWADRIETQPIQQNATVSGKIQAGYAVGDFVTKKGDRIKFRNLDYAMERGMPTEDVGYGGFGYDRTGFDMYVLPVYKIREEMGRKNITIYTKKNKLSDGTEINRGLIIGYQSGMTGLTNSTGQDAGEATSREIEAAYLSQFKIQSPIDQEVIMFGSEFSLAVYNVDDIFKMEAKFPNFQ
jgi:hypothetical protein